MKKNNPWLYIPIETKVRELHGKTLLASFAAANGFNVVIGSKKDINSRSAYLPKGIIFNVGLAKNLAKNAKRYKKYGHKVAAIDEEGIVTLNDDLYLRHRVSRETLDVTDMFFCWGKRQAGLIKRKAVGTNCEIFVTGNPRFDMLRTEYKVVFDKDAEEIRKKYGKFILVNTNFGHGNHFAGNDFLLESFREKGWMDNPDDKTFFLDNIEWQKRMFEEFQKIIPKLSEKFKDHNIIIRPHPSENHEFWKKIAKRYSNVFVVHSGNVIPWLMASEVLVHNGCTTAIESFILGTKTVAYRPFVVADQETELPNVISVQAHNVTELLDAVDKIINTHVFDDKEAAKEVYLDSYLAGIHEKTASENIASHLWAGAGNVLKNRGINYFLLLYFEIFSRAKKMMQKILFHADVSESYLRHKISDLSKNEIDEIISDFSKINKRFANLRVRKVGGTCFHIYEK